MVRSRPFWVLLGLASAACAVFAYAYFPMAFPLVTLDLSMDRSLAFEKSRLLAEKHQWGPAAYRQAASFALDRQVQNFVELEAGGTDAFRKILAEGIYSPFTWQVRHFNEGEPLEVSIRFTPSGVPYGFTLKLPEDEPGATIARAEAQPLAESAAGEEWAIDLSLYELVEASQEVRPGGRTDHRFVYRRQVARIGAGEYRLRLVVGGDRLTEIRHFIKVPEAFARRYEEMRSANSAISVASTIVMITLYVACGCFVALFFMVRHRWVLWRQPVVWGFGISALQVLSALNQWPLMWMSYDTALSATSFVLRQMVELLIRFGGLGILFSLSFMAAEGLSRRAFGHHIRLWRLWSTPVAATPAVAGRTVAGYLLVTVFFAYEVGLYFFSTRVMGWWTPSSAPFDPNVLAAFFPWLTSIAISLQAGFWEECLFRAVPIAGAALIGERFGGRRAWIVGAFILQALVFGAGHASYPAQPAYARLVELIIPSIGFGLLYLTFGLSVVIVLHFAFDVVWIALPLFVSKAQGIWVDQMVVVLLTLVPLWMVLSARRRTGRWERLSAEDLNRTWQPPAVPDRPEKAFTKADREWTTAFPRMTKPLVVAGGALALGAWVLISDFRADAPALETGRTEAITLARDDLARRGITLGDPWRTMATVGGGADQTDRFIWQEGGERVYQDMLGTYLAPPHWRVRFAQFEGDVAERAEEYLVWVGPTGNILRRLHLLPESRSGEDLPEEQARALALSALDLFDDLDGTEEMARGDVEEISAVPSKHPHRVDWRLTFADRRGYTLAQGEARIAVEIAGDEVADAYRWIHVPEQWQRRERDRQARAQIVSTLGWAVVSALLMSGIVSAIVAWSRGRFALRLSLGFFALLAGLGLLNLANTWPAIKSRFTTAQPLDHQVLIFVGMSVVLLLVTSATPALIIGFTHRLRHAAENPVLGRRDLILLGVAAGLIIAGVSTKPLAPPSSPTWADFSAHGTYVPLLSAALSPLAGFVRTATFFLLLVAVTDWFSGGWGRRRALTVVLLALVGLALGGVASSETLASWLVAGLMACVIIIAGYIFLMRFEMALVPLAVGMASIMGELEKGLHQAYSAALPGAVLAAIAIGALAFFWSMRLREPHREGAEEAGETDGY